MKKFIVVAFVVSCVVAKAQSGMANLVLKKGDAFEKISNITSTNKVEMMGQTVESNSNSAIQTTYSVDGAGADYQLGVTLKKLSVNIHTMGQEINYDSNKPGDTSSALGAVAKNFMGKPTQISVDKSGIITAIQNNAEPNALAGLLANIGISGNEMAVGNLFELAGSLPTNAKLKKGYSWMDSSGIEDNKQTSTFVVDAINGNTAIVIINGQVSKNGTIEQSGMQLTTKLTGKFRGNMEVDIATNTLLKKNITIQLSGDMEMMGMSVPTSSLTTITEIVTRQ